MSSPVFDHEKEASEGIDKSVRFLTQDGHRFSYAIWDRQEKRYKPEPKYVPEGLLTKDDMRAKLDNMLFRMVELEREIKEARGHIVNNLEQFEEREQNYWAIERAKYENAIAKLSNSLKEMEEAFFGEQVTVEKLREENNTLKAQLQVYETTIKKFKDAKPSVRKAE